MIFFMAGIFFSCENDLETIKTVTATDDTPSEIVNDMHTLYSDSGAVVYEIIGTRMEKFNDPIELTVFKNGFEVNIFGGDTIVSKLTAEYAEIRSQSNMIVARNNVIFTNFEKAQTLKTEELFWDQLAERVRTDKQFTILGADSEIMVYGVDSDVNFSDYNAHKVSFTKLVNNNDTLQ